DGMVDMIGELAVALSMVTQNPEFAELKVQRMERDMAQLDRITSGLQKTAMSLRMLPVRQTFQRMVRLTRDLSQKSGKKVELRMEGQDTEIDRSMVEAISDPLVHMVRNSVDHGLEAAEERQAAGKPEAGKVTLRAYHQGGRIVIEVEDDGRGLDTEKILAKAIDRGLVAPETELTESKVYRLIMQPGFSTAEKVTDISGRGVGMDVVKAAVEKLRGHLEITSEKGRYTRFTIRLPLTMAVIEGMIVGLGGECFIIPTLGIEEVFRPEGKDISTGPGATGEVMLRGRLLPLLRLGKLFGLDPPPPSRSGSFAGVVVVVSEGHRKAVMVDELLGKQEVVVKSLGAGLKEVRGLTGGTILGDGRVGLILDVKNLFQMAAEEAGSGGIRAESVVEGRPAPGAGEDGFTSEADQ
ncbi:MAG: chemotaxis protein CheA, partial [Deltaproteobacteria bacterium]|nr:chemotaxis protein CheA [Deltaproteobacteria bacterium]